MADAAREAFFYKKLAQEVEAIEIDAVLYCDNIAAQTIANGESSPSTRGAKPIDIRYHIVRDLNKSN